MPSSPSAGVPSLGVISFPSGSCPSVSWPDSSAALRFSRNFSSSLSSLILFIKFLRLVILDLITPIFLLTSFKATVAAATSCPSPYLPLMISLYPLAAVFKGTISSSNFLISSSRPLLIRSSSDGDKIFSTSAVVSVVSKASCLEACFLSRRTIILIVSN